MNHKLVRLTFDSDMLLVDLGSTVSYPSYPKLLCQTEDGNPLMVIDADIDKFEIDESKCEAAFGDEWDYDDCFKFITDGRENGFEKFIERFELK